ncbi:MAG TPA: hypothetical protein VN908_06830 [Gemmatimonadales bacterium]|nr:hypothetical protein [Gemmatimonadales bacterium]
MRLLAAAVLVLQGSTAAPAERADLRAGLDTLYGGEFARAAAFFARLAASHPADPAPVVFEAGAYIWWAAARDSADFELERIDSLLGLALTRARAAPQADFWLATALGYRARQREEHGHGFGAAKDAKAMRDIYRRILAADSSCADCYLGLGVYEYGLARASALARLFAKIIGLGSGNAERGIRYMRRVAHDGDLARVEGTWVLAAALVREAARDAGGRPVLEHEARGYVQQLAARYPGNPLFQQFLREVSSEMLPQEAVRAATGAASAPGAGTAVGRGQRGQLPQHVVDVTLHGVGRDVEPLGDLLVAEPGGNQILDFLLPLGQADRGGAGHGAGGADAARAVARNHARDRGRRQIPAVSDRANRFHEVIGRRIFHDEAVGPAFDEAGDVVLGGDEIHYDGFGVRSDCLETCEEGVAVAVRQRGVHQHHVRFRIAHLFHAGVRPFNGRDHLHVPERGQEVRQSVAHQSIVFDDEHANPHRSRFLTHAHAPIPAAPVARTVALCQPIVQAAPPLCRDPALHAANCPVHTSPPLVAGMYRTKPGGRQRSWG